MTYYDWDGLIGLAQGAGFRDGWDFTAAALAQRESGGYSDAAQQNNNPNITPAEYLGTWDVGILQLNAHAFPQYSSYYDKSSCAWDPVCAFRAVYTITQGTNFGPWTDWTDKENPLVPGPYGQNVRGYTGPSGGSGYGAAPPPGGTDGVPAFVFDPTNPQLPPTSSGGSPSAPFVGGGGLPYIGAPPNLGNGQYALNPVSVSVPYAQGGGWDNLRQLWGSDQAQAYNIIQEIVRQVSGSQG